MTDDLQLIRRNTIIWHKRNCMPSSAKDRLTIDFEYVYFFTKSRKYYFETQYEPFDGKSFEERARYNYGGNNKAIQIDKRFKRDFKIPHTISPNPLGRIKRTVWQINTQPFKEAHFAVFPEKLIEPMIKAGCPEYICTKCKTPRMLEYEETRINSSIKFGGNKGGGTTDQSMSASRTYSGKEYNPVIRSQLSMTKCNCNEDFKPGIVLDPFMGSGTTALVALTHARDFIGIELNKEYIDMATKRLAPLLTQTKLVSS
jgi:site-specific DNA-methyltransferase (adenine-specific)